MSGQVTFEGGKYLVFKITNLYQVNPCWIIDLAPKIKGRILYADMRGPGAYNCTLDFMYDFSLRKNLEKNIGLDSAFVLSFEDNITFQDIITLYQHLNSGEFKSPPIQTIGKVDDVYYVKC